MATMTAWKPESVLDILFVEDISLAE